MAMPVIIVPVVTVEMHMPLTVMLVIMRMPSLAVQSECQRPAEHYQEDAHARFSNDLESLRNAQSPRQYDRPHKHQRQRVADPPPQPDCAGGPERWPFSEDRRDRGEMIGIKSMPNAEQESDTEQ
jgi:hypothetical protein